MTPIETPLTEAFYYILLAVRKPNYGYGITQEVSDLTGGRVQLGAGTLYGALQTLEKRKWIEIFSEDTASRKKKEYLITELGKVTRGLIKIGFSNMWCPNTLESSLFTKAK